MLATVSFAVIFNAPRKEWLYTALTGALGWIIYYIMTSRGISSVISCLMATFFLTLISRVLSAIRKCPVTMYLLPGIFPLVPGAGIYYTSYYFIMNDLKNFSDMGSNTFQTAGAIAIGIIFASAIPQKVFSWLN